MNWQDILLILGPLGAFSGWFYSRIDKKFQDIKDDMKEMRTEFSNEMKVMRTEFSKEMKEMRFEFSNEMKEMKFEFSNETKEIRSDISSLNTKIAVIESKLTDINTNLTHLMWHQQAIPPKDAKEE